MSDQIVKTVNKPRRHMASDGMLSSPNSVRIYRNSPEDVMLQMRRTKDYIGIALTFVEAREVAARLIAACEYN